MRIIWHVDDLTLSHVEKDIFDAFIQVTKDKNKYITKLKPSKVKIHDYLAMTLDYTTSGEVKILIKEYIGIII